MLGRTIVKGPGKALVGHLGALEEALAYYERKENVVMAERARARLATQ